MKTDTKSKKAYIWILIAILAFTAFIISIPDIIVNSIPTAQNVTVKKVTHLDAVEVSGSVVEDVPEGILLVQAFVGEKDISKVAVGQEAEITGDAFPDRVYGGVVKTIADTAAKIQVGNTLKTMVQVDIEIPEADGGLKPGFTAQAKIKTAEPSEMTVLPYEAVNQDEQGEYVFVLESGKAVKK